MPALPPDMEALAPIHAWRAIASGGGPLVLLPDALLPQWRGLDGPPDSDYDRACGVPEPLGSIPVAGGEALVLSGEPADTALLPSRSGRSLVLAQWRCGPDAATVVDCLRRLDLARFPPPAVRLRLTGSPQALFDSAYPGLEICECLTAGLPAGEYAASALPDRPRAGVSLALHWLRPVG